jgi:hypothetical protein
MTADILVVARNQPSLYAYLRLDFADDPDVAVVMDRRVGDRRRREEPWSAERRREERRMQEPLDDRLASMGFAIVKIA